MNLEEERQSGDNLMDRIDRGREQVKHTQHVFIISVHLSVHTQTCLCFMSACKWVLDLLSLCLPFLTSWLQPLISKWKGTFDLHITASGLRCVLKELMCVILVQVHGFFQVSVSLHVISVLKNSLFLSGLDKVDGLLLCKMILHNHSGWQLASMV